MSEIPRSRIGEWITMLEQELKIFENNLPEWLKSHSGKFALIKGDELIGFFNTTDEALEVGARRFGLQPFLVRRITAQQEEIRIPALTLGVLRADFPHTISG